jgi:hypothetical protein
VVELFTQWVAAQAVPGLTCEVLQEPNRTPLIFIEVPATGGEGGDTQRTGGGEGKLIGGDAAQAYGIAEKV